MNTIRKHHLSFHSFIYVFFLLYAYSQSVHRQPPVPSPKTRNRVAHCNNGNTEQQPSSAVTRRSRQQHGLRQNMQKAKKRRIANASAAKKKRRTTTAAPAAAASSAPAPASPATPKPLFDEQHTRRRPADSDDDWVPIQPPIKKRCHSVPPRTSDAFAQTTDNTHHDAFKPPSPFVLTIRQLLSMQLRYNLTARQMRGVMFTYAKAAPRGVTMHEVLTG